MAKTTADTTPAPEKTVSKVSPEMKKLIAADKKARKGEPATLVTPLAFKLVPGDDWNPDDPSAYSRACISVHPVVSPLFDALMIDAGCTRIGSRTYVLGLGEDSSWSSVKRVFSLIPPIIVWTGASAKDIDKLGVRRTPTIDRLGSIRRDIQETPLGKGKVLDFLTSADYIRTIKDKDMLAKTCVIVEVSNSRIYFRVATSRTNAKGLVVANDTPDLNVLKADGSRSEPVTMTPDRALLVAEALVKDGYEVINDELDLGMLSANLRGVLVAQPCDGSPGRSRFVVGGDIKRVPGLNLGAYTGDARVAYVGAENAGNIITRARKRGMQAFAHPAVEDIGQMATASPAPFEGARPYQEVAVGIHLATNLGYLNACSPGLGKTVISIEALKAKAENTKGYRALIVVPANIRSQWLSETKRFWEDANVVVLNTIKTIDEDLKKWNKETGDGSGIVITSYNAATDALKHFKKVKWDDLVVDEAAFLKNSSSKRTKAIWKLRSASKVAVALTGTPIEKNLDDLGAIVAWVRNDPTLFRGRRLSNRFDVGLPGHTEELWEHIGPTVFRRDRSEIADELPDITTDTIILDPEPAELRLAEACRRELKGIYEKLAKRLIEAEEADPTNPEFKELREEIQSMRGAVLGGIPLARMAASDPHAVAASESMAVAMLDGKGLVEPAVATGGTKRRQIGGLVKDLADRGEAVLVFTDFERCARNLVEDLEKEGVRVGMFAGSMPIKKRDKNKDDYQNGDLDVLILTASGQEGHNLQRTTVLVHYDLPWKTSSVLQRVGRANRIGAKGSHLSVIIPLMAGTIEERVAAVLLPRAIMALTVLDSHRGVDVSQTEIAQALHGLDKAVSEDEREKADAGEGIWELAKEIFGEDYI